VLKLLGIVFSGANHFHPFYLSQIQDSRVADDADPSVDQLALSNPDSHPMFIGGDAFGNQGSLLIYNESRGLSPVFLVSKTLCLICPDLNKDRQFVEI
jgi:hypothetical protein